ncbi:cytochrome P450 [Blastocladiella britannica]|nr:cytochrome P450 [Blastocladiella britannica]
MSATTNLLAMVPATAAALFESVATRIRGRERALAVTLAITLPALRLALKIVSGRILANRVRFTNGDRPYLPPIIRWYHRYLWGVVFLVVSDGTGSFVKWHRRHLDHGRMYMSAGMFGAPALVLADPKALHAILSGNAYRFAKPKELQKGIARFTGHHGLLVLEGDEHKKHRRIITPVFNMNVLKKLIPVMDHALDELAGIIDHADAEDKTVEFQALSTALTLNVIGRTALATDFDALNQTKQNPLFEAYEKLLSLFGLHTWAIVRAFVPLAIHLPVKANTDVMESRAFVFGEVEAIVRKLQAGGGANSEQYVQDSLANVLQQNQLRDNGASGSDGVLNAEDIRDEMLTFLVAGHETTSNALSMGLYFLAKHPAAQEKLATALLQLPEPVAIDDLLKLPELTNVINETLRMHSPAFVTRREALHDSTVPMSDGRSLFIPKGLDIVIPIQAMHLHPDVFPNPDTFDPDRWNSIHIAGQEKPAGSAEILHELHPMEFLPFLAGPRACIGRQFALMELRVFLARLLRDYSVSLGPNQGAPKIQYTLTAKPKALDLRFERRGRQ